MAPLWRHKRHTTSRLIVMGIAGSPRTIVVATVFLVATLSRELVERTTATEELAPAPGTPRHVAAEMVKPAWPHTAVTAPLATSQTRSSVLPERKEIEGHTKHPQR
jgi:hypothetical protein